MASRCVIGSATESSYGTAGLAWTATDVPGTDRVCAELSPQPGLELYLDNVWAASDGGND